MKFTVVYVEDKVRDWENLWKSVDEQNAKLSDDECIALIRADSPSHLKQMIGDVDVDFVLADVFFKKAGVEVDSLSEIIDIVENWSKEKGYAGKFPIIAYTSRGEAALRRCLQEGNRLYDIWDKQTADSPYAAWRLGRIRADLLRVEEDACLQRTIRKMVTEISWHELVKKMSRDYDGGWSEKDQVVRVQDSIVGIADSMDADTSALQMWKHMSAWEDFSRLESPGVRGHARHVVNVFWLGYVLINNCEFFTMFGQLWENRRRNQDAKDLAKNISIQEEICNSWYWAALFHDVAGCVEKGNNLTKNTKDLYSLFGDFASFDLSLIKFREQLFVEGAKLLASYANGISKEFEASWNVSVENGRPDHGVVAALLIRDKLGHHLGSCVHDAGRAMALHNLIGGLKGLQSSGLKWGDEPLCCLLILCDQLQTWDRERGDETLMERDWPRRAELLNISVEHDGIKPVVNMEINYITTRPIEKDKDVFERVSKELKEILRKFPKTALNTIAKPWPFCVNVKFLLQGKNLELSFKLD